MAIFPPTVFVQRSHMGGLRVNCGVGYHGRVLEILRSAKKPKAAGEKNCTYLGHSKVLTSILKRIEKNNHSVYCRSNNNKVESLHGVGGREKRKANETRSPT